MDTEKRNQWPILNDFDVSRDYDLLIWIEAFLIDRKAQNMASGTLYFYQKKLGLFAQYCDLQVITNISQIIPGTIRNYLFWLENTGHNPGGIFCCYRALKTFLLWWENEVEPENWHNPIRKVKQPRVALELLDPVAMDTVEKLIDVCPRGSFYGARDYAIILFLFDTGSRASELVSIDFEDYNQISGEVFIRVGKGRKPRSVFLGKKTRQALRAYLRQKPHRDPLWVTQEGERLSYWGLNEILSRRAHDAGIDKPELHSFRRAFALNMLRSGVDLYSISKLMGHTDLQILKRYLKQISADLKSAHEKGSPVDRNLKR